MPNNSNIPSNQNKPCPCTPNNTYENCCQPFHLKVAIAQTPEKLMRSRYSAFVMEKYQYLIETHHKDFRENLTIENLKSNENLHWLGLEVIFSKDNKTSGQVEFKAWYKLNDDIDAIFELSNFIKEDGVWYYTNGVQKDAKLPKRNDPCVCQSGKKFKHCCLNKEQ